MSLTANATAHSSAADEDSPAPSGTVSVTCTSRPPTAWPSARNAQSTPAT